MTKVAEIAENDLVQALQSALAENINNRDGFRTSRELMADLGCTHQSVLDRLHWLKARGQLETGNIFVENIAGRKQSVPAYRLATKDEIP